MNYDYRVKYFNQNNEVVYSDIFTSWNKAYNFIVENKIKNWSIEYKDFNNNWK
jgi:hypothetical protein